MGADGGLTWMRVLDKARFAELTACFGLRWSDSYHDSEHIAFLDKNPLPTDYVIIPYGTDLNTNGFDSLKQMLVEAGDLPYFYQGADDTFTFADILQDAYTRPYNPDPQGELERVLFEATHFGWYYPFEKFKKYRRDFLEEARNKIESIIEEAQLHPIFSMPAQTWKREVEHVVVLHTYGLAETWT